MCYNTSMKKIFVCNICSANFTSAHPGRNPKYCSSRCYGDSKLGVSTWNKGTKGVMKPNSGSFKYGKNHRLWTGKNTHYYVVPISKRGKSRHIHRDLMEKHLGRKLAFNEVVHHIDHNKHNNAIENLKLMTRSEHTTYHCNVRWGNIKIHSET